MGNDDALAYFNFVQVDNNNIDITLRQSVLNSNQDQYLVSMWPSCIQSKSLAFLVCVCLGQNFNGKECLFVFLSCFSSDRSKHSKSVFLSFFFHSFYFEDRTILVKSITIYLSHPVCNACMNIVSLYIPHEHYLIIYIALCICFEFVFLNAGGRLCNTVFIR